MLLQLTRQNVVGPASGSGASIDAASVSAAAAAASSAAAGGLAPLPDLPQFSLPTDAAASYGSSLPPNPLAGLVGAQLQQWMAEAEEDDNADMQEEEGEEEEDGEAEDAESQPATPARVDGRKERGGGGSSKDGKGDADRAARRPAQRAAASSSSGAAAAAASASSAAAASSPAQATPAKQRKAKKRSAASLLADDSAELKEIMGSGLGGAAPSSSRGKMMLLRRGTRVGKLSQLTPDLERRMGEANSAYIGNDFARAVDILLHIIQAAPHALGPYHTLGLIYEERGDMHKAVEAYMLAAHMSKRDWPLWKRVAKMAAENGQLEHATYCWSKVLLAETDNSEVRMERSLAYFELKDYRRALDGFQYLLRKCPHDPALLRQAASCYSHMERPQAGVLMLLDYLEWFKATLARNKERDEADPDVAREHRAKRARYERGELPEQQQQQAAAESGDAAAAAAAAPALPSTGGVDPSLLVPADLDINLVNILCELYLDLHKFQEVVDVIEDLLPALRANIRRSMALELRDPDSAAGEGEGDEEAAGAGAESDPSDASIELPMDLHSKLGIAYLYLREFSLADAIFAPLLASATPGGVVTYDVESWGDLYFDVAEAYVNNRMYPQAERMCQALLTVPEWNNSLVWLLQAKCVHHQAVAQLHQQSLLHQSVGSEAATAAAALHTEQLRHALKLYERVHAAENGENVDVRLALSELYHTLGETERAKEILRGIDIEAHHVAVALGPHAIGARGARADAALSRLRAAAAPSASFLQKQDELRIFSQSCELLLQSGSRSEFLALAVPVVVNIVSVAVLGLDDEDEFMPHERIVPTVAGPAAASATAAASSTTGAGAGAGGNVAVAAPRFLDMAVDKGNAFPAQRLMLSFEFLRPAFATVKQLYAQGRLAETLWLIGNLERLLQRYTRSAAQHSSTSSVQHGGTGGASLGGGGGAHSSDPASLVDHVRLLLLGLKYVSAGIFLRLHDHERAYKCLRPILAVYPYSFPLAHSMNAVLNAQSYPSRAVKSLERLLNKTPDALPLQLLLAHGCLIHQNYESALVYYLRLRAALPGQPMLSLLVGVTKLQLALKKTNRQRHHDLLAAFAFLFHYAEQKKREAAQPHAEQEACYNVARACQNVGLFYMARPMYERVLALAAVPSRRIEGATEAQQGGGAAEAATAATPTAMAPARISSLHAEAAHNLAIIYTQSGSPELARRLYAQYCRV